MKTWKEAEIKELEINETAFGPCDPTVNDSEKTQFVDSDGNIGYVQEQGESAGK